MATSTTRKDMSQQDAKNRVFFSIHRKILLFALTVTLIPALGLGWVFYTQAERTLSDRTEQELLASVTHAERELDLWLKERSHEVRILSNAYLISENLSRLNDLSRLEGSDERIELIRNLNRYLSLVSDQFPHYNRLVIFDRYNHEIAESPLIDRPLRLPADWREQLAQGRSVVSNSYGLDQRSEVPQLFVAIPINSVEGELLGVFAGELKRVSLRAIINTSPLLNLNGGESVRMFIIHNRGGTLVPIRTDGGILKAGIQAVELFKQPRMLSEYTDTRGRQVFAILAPLSQLPGGIVMEKSFDEVFFDAVNLRNMTVLLVLLLLAFIGFIAYRISRGILAPLERLTQGATQVATGDLSVELPVERRDELGITTQVFNDMVKQLGQSQEKLELLSITDALTGLANRKQIMEILSIQIERYRRYRTPFSILMIDLDHFKRVNDQYGHLAGDRVLIKVATMFRSMLRSADIAGRYGGEEFLVLLEETAITEAVQTAERIRNTVSEMSIEYEGTQIPISISVGVAEVNQSIDKDDELIHMADEALYKAKQGGRNRVVMAPTNLLHTRTLPEREGIH